MALEADDRRTGGAERLKDTFRLRLGAAAPREALAAMTGSQAGRSGRTCTPKKGWEP